MTDKTAIALFKGLMEGLAAVTKALNESAGNYNRDEEYWFHVYIQQALNELPKE